MSTDWDSVTDDSYEYSPPRVFVNHRRGYVRTNPSPTDSQIFSPQARRKRQEKSGIIDDFSDDDTFAPSTSVPTSSGTASSATIQDDEGAPVEIKDKDISCEEWMRRSKYWEGFPGVWDPIRCIGKDTFGIVGLFEYAGEDKSAFPRYIVVKQSGPGPGYLEALKRESDILQQLGKLGDKHIVKLYKSFHRSPGTGTHKERDPSPWTPPYYHLDGETYNADKEVGRIFLEFASNGDLLAYIKNKNIIDHPSEEEVWRLFYCLAQGAVAMARENEDNEAGKRPIVHLDMKPNNDHGLRTFTMGPEESSDAWNKQTEWRGTLGWLAPEQVTYNMKDRSLGLQLNSWGVGVVVNSYFTGGEAIEEGRIQLAVQRSTDSPANPEEKFYSHECAILDAPCSDYLKYVLFRTLAYDPAYRWTPRQLVEITGTVVDQYNKGTVQGETYLLSESGTIIDFYIDRYPEDWTKLNFQLTTPPKVGGDYDSAISQAVGDFDVLELPSGQSQPLSRRASWETLLPSTDSDDESPGSTYEFPSTIEEWV